MQVDSLQKFFASSPAVRLIRSPHAFWIVDFLRTEFKLAGQITRRHSELTIQLDAYLDQLTKDGLLVVDGKSDSREKADTYLSAWCSASIGWLKRFVEEDVEEPCYQLTAEFEKALDFVDRATRPAAFIGTESKMRTILEVLGDVVKGVETDPTERLRHLELEKQRLENEIQQLRNSPTQKTLNETQVRERFQLALQQLRQLKSEFRSVEDRFKAITRGVQQRILAASDSRGEILQFALDSEDMLKHGDQGQSFFEFLKLLHSPDNQDRINELIAQLNQIEALAEQEEDLQELRLMVPTLIAEAEKILRTTQHLSVTLRRLLDSRSTRHHQRLSHLLRDILGAAAAQSNTPPTEVGLDVEVELEVQCPFDRPFWSATEPFEEVELQPQQSDPEQQQAALKQLVELERLHWTQMRSRIREATSAGKECALSELLERFPIEAGAIEVLGYLQIAHDDGHRIDRTQTTQLPASATGRLGRQLTIPHVVFVPSANARTRQRQTNQAPATRTGK
ncbi:MAG: DUF3375 family protein [Aureliella sp.]